MTLQTGQLQSDKSRGLPRCLYPSVSLPNAMDKVMLQHTGERASTLPPLIVQPAT
jgi:hypothetical protein